MSKVLLFNHGSKPTRDQIKQAVVLQRLFDLKREAAQSKHEQTQASKPSPSR